MFTYGFHGIGVNLYSTSFLPRYPGGSPAATSPLLDGPLRLAASVEIGRGSADGIGRDRHGSHARRERQAWADLAALVETTPVGIAVFDVPGGPLVSLNREVRRWRKRPRNRTPGEMREFYRIIDQVAAGELRRVGVVEVDDVIPVSGLNRGLRQPRSIRAGVTMSSRTVVGAPP